MIFQPQRGKPRKTYSKSIHPSNISNYAWLLTLFDFIEKYARPISKITVENMIKNTGSTCKIQALDLFTIASSCIQY
jgi:hypothetical protein